MCIRDRYYFTYSKGFRPGGGNASIPYDPTFTNLNFGCTGDFQTEGLTKGAPATYKSDSVSYTHLDVYKRQAEHHLNPLCAVL